MNINIKPKYSKSVLKAIKTPELKNEVLKATKSNEEALREIKRVFKVANERVRQLSKNTSNDVLSPALVSIKTQQEKASGKYNVFNATGKNWYQLRMQYAKAVAFIQSPTSTLSGAKQFSKQMKQGLGIKDENQWNRIKDKINEFYQGKEGLIRSNGDSERQSQQFYKIAVKNSSQHIENESNDLVERIERNVENFANHATKEIEKAIENNITNGFKIVTKRE